MNLLKKILYWFFVSILIIIAGGLIIYYGRTTAPYQRIFWGIAPLKPETLSVKNGFDKYVLRLPSRSNEQNYQVSLVVGKEVTVDTCNESSFFNSLIQKTDPEEGDYIEVSVSPLMSTMVHCNGKIFYYQTFITLDKVKETPLPYSSKKPLIIHVPKGFEVGYRIQKST